MKGVKRQVNGVDESKQKELKTIEMQKKDVIFA